MNTILDYVHRWADECPDKPAIISRDGVISYRELYARMKDNQHPTPDTQLPIPLLGESWESDFCLYTTGTTGKSKGVVISQKAVISNSENLIAGQGFTHDLVFVIAGSMEHLGCWSKIFPVLMLGATIYIIEDGMKDIDGFFKAFDLPLEKYSLPANTKFATFLVPSNIRILLQFASDRLEALADRMDFLETGAAPMPHSDMLTLCKILPNTRLYNTYASTETGIIATYDFQQGECVEGCLGKAMKNSSFYISPEGTIVCQGKTLMSGYVGNPQLTAKVLHDNRLFTTDKATVDAYGQLHLQGRSDDVINTGGFKVNPLEVENVAMQIPAIADCVCIPAQHPVMGVVLKLLVVLAPDAQFNKRAIAQQLAQQLESYKVPLIYEQVTTIHRTYNGKINRRSYARS